MLVTDGGRLIRCPADQISITGRVTQGVRVFRVDEDEHVVSVSLAPDEGNGEVNDHQDGDIDVVEC